MHWKIRTNLKFIQYEYASTRPLKIVYQELFSEKKRKSCSCNNGNELFTCLYRDRRWILKKQNTRISKKSPLFVDVKDVSQGLLGAFVAYILCSLSFACSTLSSMLLYIIFWSGLESYKILLKYLIHNVLLYLLCSLRKFS